MKYLVKTYCLEWHDVGYIVEADSEEEARKLAEEMEGDIYYDTYDITDQIDIKSVEEFDHETD